jgi:hypothetical protein
MYFYVTEKIKYFHKIGIANNLKRRFDEYRTLIPDLKAAYAIDVPDKIAKKLENYFKISFKRHCLRRSTKNVSECYNLKLKYIKEFILKSSILLNYPLINIRYINYTRGYSSTFQFSERANFKFRLSYNDTFFIYLDHLYFNKNIPLLVINKINKKKIQIEIINKVSKKELSKKANWSEEYMSNFSLKNTLYEDLKEDNNKLINNISINKLLPNLEKIIFKAIKNYLESRKSPIGLGYKKNFPNNLKDTEYSNSTNIYRVRRSISKRDKKYNGLEISEIEYKKNWKKFYEK